MNKVYASLTNQKQYDISLNYMAGNSERLTGQAASNLGEYHLNNLLTRLRTQSMDTWDHLGSFKQAKNAIHSATGINIPQALSEQLWLLDVLSWRIAASKMSLLLIGGNFDSNKKADINQALVAIDVARRMKIVNGREEPGLLYLRIAGVTKDRIVAATYDIENNNRLSKLNVSVSNMEFTTIASASSRDMAAHLTTSIPSNIGKPYDTAGLITAAMLDGLHKTKALLSPHSQALVVQFTQG